MIETWQQRPQTAAVNLRKNNEVGYETSFRLNTGQAVVDIPIDAVLGREKSRTCTEEVMILILILIVDEKMKGVVKTSPRLVSVMK